MTIPYERTQALLRTRGLLSELADGAQIEQEPLRRRAAALLKHYPDAWHVVMSARPAGYWADPNAKWFESP